MLIQTDNGCVYDIKYAKLNRKDGGEETHDDIFWPMNFECPLIRMSTIMQNRVIYSALMNETPHVKYTAFNPLVLTNNAFDQEFIPSSWGKRGKKNDDDDDDDDDDAQGANMIVEKLKILKKYKKFLDFAQLAMNSPYFETYQKSSLYELMFFRLSKENADCIREVTYGLHDYLGFSAANLKESLEGYTRKSFFFILPRGTGKTTIIKVCISALVMTMEDTNVFVVSQNKNVGMEIRLEVLKALNKYFPDIKYDYKLYTPGDFVELKFNTGTVAKVQFASATRDGSLRGPDPEYVLVDEAIVIEDERYAYILALTQRGRCKMGLFSSPVSTKKERYIQLVHDLNNCPDAASVYRLTYFCENHNHLRYSKHHSGCLRLLYTPNHINLNANNKDFTDVMTRSDGFAAELGVILPEEFASLMESTNANMCFSQEFINYFKNPNNYIYVDKVKFIRAVDQLIFFIYVDPAYNAATSSGIGLACTMRVKKNRVVVYVDHKMIRLEELKDTEFLILDMIKHCVKTVYSHVARMGKKIKFFIAVENNNNQALASTIYSNMMEVITDEMDANPPMIFLYYHPKSKVGGYHIDANKIHICNRIISECNAWAKLPYGHRKLFVSTLIGSSLFIKIENPIALFLREAEAFAFVIKKRTYTGKLKHTTPDDVIISFILSMFLARQYADIAENLDGTTAAATLAHAQMWELCKFSDENDFNPTKKVQKK